MEKNPLYCFDGTNLGFRAHAAYPDLTFEDFPVGALYGTARILMNFVKEWSPGRIVMPFDVSKSHYRQQLFPEYKLGKARLENNHAQLKERFVMQLDMIHELMAQFGVLTITEESRGIESDDTIAYLVHRYKQGAFPNIKRVVVFSSDQDLCALVAPEPFKVHWYNPIKSDLVTAENFKERFGVEIAQYRDYKALKGDVSDNIPHPPGIGPKNAVKLLNTYGSIQHMLEIKHEKLVEHQAVLELGMKLVSLNLHEVQAEHPCWELIERRCQQASVVDPEGLRATLAGLSFASILDHWEELLPRLQGCAACPL